ncbi:bifunctional pyr operon transcriptional regulator/uracil phosphoribosyltransferase, partial [bacterium]|nr:bifunctional pyr operon transcriptional regulator/uracil phosphoribosyltransferase [bacterium]
MEFVQKKVIMTEKEVHRALTRVAHEIIEANKGTDNLILLGIQRRGVPLAALIGDI